MKILKQIKNNHNKSLCTPYVQELVYLLGPKHTQDNHAIREDKPSLLSDGIQSFYVIVLAQDT